jgi:hypothetical protein
MRRKQALIAGILGGAALCVLLVSMLPGGAYRRRETSAESDEVRRSLELLRQIAAAPETADGRMSPSARANARVAVARAAQRMAEADSVELRDAAWFGDYLRVGVTCPQGGGEPVELYFFLREEGGELRITGLQM